MSDSFKQWRRWAPLLLFVADLTVLCGGLVIGHEIRFGSWVPLSGAQLQASVIVLLVYGVALFASGAYHTTLRSLHLSEFLRMAFALCIAWVTSVTLAYLVNPSDLPSRSVMVVHGLVSLVGVLGLRAVMRRGLEWWSPTTPGPPPFPRPSVSLDDIVAREPARIDRAEMIDHLSNRTVLVTGAGGSVGSELSRQLVGLQPFRLGLVDVSEYNLYQLEKDLRGRSFDGEVAFCIGDVRDEAMMDRLFERLQPDVVLHTAAYKQVPLMERHPAEAFRNNTMATVHLLRLCERYDTEQFVFVSTDKAVEPTSVLGATKRLAEWYVQAATSDVNRKIVRFGNVFGSQGSVVPLFEEQLAEGNPVTVTHPDMERYFMSVNEACSLILQTLLLEIAPVYFFRMGDPVDIEDVARTLVRHWYPSVDPASMIEYVGRRPGEKLSEDLVMPCESTRATSHESIVGLDGSVPFSRTELELYFRYLNDLSQQTADTHAALRRALFTPDFDATLEDLSS